MKFGNMIDELLLRFPILKNTYESEGDYIENLQHLCYSIVFVPFIEKTVLTNDENMMQLICGFMEDMANSKDEMVLELLAVSILEPMLSEREIISSLKSSFGVRTLEIVFVIEKEYGWC